MSVSVFSVTAGGCGVERFASPGGEELLPVRLCAGHVDDDQDGVLREMKRGLAPRDRLPWVSREARDGAARRVLAMGWVDPAEREALSAYIAASPYYE